MSNTPVTIPTMLVRPSAPPPGEQWSPINSDKVRALAESMKEIGLHEPISVRPALREKGAYEMVNGRHRYLAAVRLGWTEIDAFVLDEAQQPSAQVDPPVDGTVAPVRFDYGILDRVAAEDLRALAGRVRCLIKRTTTAIIRVGDELNLAKGKLDHGLWESWLRAEFAMSRRTAERFMAAAKWAEGKSDTVSLLEPSTVYLLSARSTPEPISEQVIADTTTGKIPSTEEVRERIKKAKEDNGRAAKQRRGQEVLADIVALLTDHMDIEDLRRLQGLLEAAAKTSSLKDVARAIAGNSRANRPSASPRLAAVELTQ